LTPIDLLEYHFLQAGDKKIMWKVWIIALVLSSCGGIERSENQKIKQSNETKELIYRTSSEKLYPNLELKTQIRDPYPWELGFVGLHPKITKEAFRCRGDANHLPKKKEEAQGQLVHDCGGGLKHSLPIAGGKEFVYPILIDLLNYVQMKTSCPVVITCGHRCPAHNSYADESIYNLSSKHMIGGEVDFYVSGMEEKPQEVIDLIMKYYAEKETYKGSREYTRFHRLENVKVNVSTPPWHNKEILIKLYKKDEGRDFDNQHSFPYVSLQVRFDREKNEKVTYSWEKAFHGYMRY
jgi:hypothetical protein